MPKRDYYIGLMSGTSADAIDAALVDFSSQKPLIVCSCSTPVPNTLKQQVFSLAESAYDEINSLRRLDRDYAELFASAAMDLCLKSSIKPGNIKALGSHGQTIRHYPANNDKPGYSLQIGDPNIIAERTGITTITDFRRRDIAAGGQGAPLAPAFHQAFFASANTNRIILNLGGVANISWLPCEGEVTGFDTGPANNLMDSWVELKQNSPFDRDGQWAASGKLSNTLLQRLLQHPFFGQQPPKSTGREAFNLNWLNNEITATKEEFQDADIQATLLALTVESIARAIETSGYNDARIYCCGGGAHNKRLLRELAKRLPKQRVSTTAELGISVDEVECTGFAWLAKQTIEGLTANLPAVTGAKKKVLLGGIYPA